MGQPLPWSRLCIQLSYRGLCAAGPMLDSQASCTFASTMELTCPQIMSHPHILIVIFGPLPALSFCVISHLVQN